LYVIRCLSGASRRQFAPRFFRVKERCTTLQQRKESPPGSSATRLRAMRCLDVQPPTLPPLFKYIKLVLTLALALGKFFDTTLEHFLGVPTHGRARIMHDVSNRQHRQREDASNGHRHGPQRVARPRPPLEEQQPPPPPPSPPPTPMGLPHRRQRPWGCPRYPSIRWRA